ncbi:histone-lysine N-methyltransferase SETDB2 [Crotalus adamanteus]|uniref:Histone-lysine N-methyltransferase SETDB2 n=1 Tax=Crotalus adamanteus TaxID=8729 RepID=A0AAW1C9B0_CROAD
MTYRGALKLLPDDFRYPLVISDKGGGLSTVGRGGVCGRGLGSFQEKAEAMKVDAKRLWKHMGKNKIDNIFECMHKALLSLQQKIKDGAATSEECNQALALVNQLGMNDLLPLAHEDKHICNPDLPLSAPEKIIEDAGDDFSLLEINEGMDLRTGESAETSSMFYQDHVCSKKCLSKRPWDSYKGENPLKLPMLCHFQSCTDGCIDRTKCSCLLLTKKALKASMSPRNGPSHGYTYKRLEEPISSGIYECSLLCSCDKNRCQNRLVQHGLQVRLQVFSTGKKGWGVRCLDDIDKGTFVCTYAGRLMSRDEHYQGKNSGDVEEEVTKNTNQSLFSRKRKLGTVCSDSENELIQDTGRQQSLHLNAEGKPNRIQNYTSYKNWNVETIARPKTKTSLLQRHQQELGSTDASSDEDESSLCHMSGTRRITPATQKRDEESSLQGEFEKLVNTLNSETNTDCHKENLLSNAALKSKLPMQDGREVKKQHKNILESDSTIKGKTQRNRQELACMNEAAEIETCPKNEENPCLLDATREGNVGRFLNHSCSPNLFVQSVFVETHNRNFPWVAFFTKRFVKAGTELTWDYGYEAGSMPETETTCQCGSLKCRKKIL